MVIPDFDNPIPTGNFAISIRLDRPISCAGSVSTYEHRGPIGGFLLAGTHCSGVVLNITTADDSAEQAEGAAQAAESFAAWAARIATAAREHANRMRQPIGGGYCPCSGAVDFYTDEDRVHWDELHDGCDDLDPDLLAKHREIREIAARRPDAIIGGAE